MGRHWALWVASIAFRIAGVVSAIALIWLALVSPNSRATLASGLGIIIPPQNNEPLTFLASVGRWFSGGLYALGLYAIGQACSVLIEMRRNSELTTTLLVRRLGSKRVPAPADPTVAVDWQTESPLQRDTMNYTRRARQPAPDVPDDDPRAPIRRRARVIVTPAPDYRQHRPTKGD